MKKILYFTIGLVSLTLVLGVTSCAEEGTAVDQGLQPVTFAFAGMEGKTVNTRTTWDDQTFPDGANIGIFVLDEKGNLVKSNARYLYSSSSKIFTPYSTANTIYTSSTCQYRYYAYSPYKSSCKLDSIRASIGAQTTAANLKSYDFLRAVNTTAAKGANIIDLTFNHLMARLDVNISYYIGLGWTETVSNSIKLKRYASGYNINLQTGKLTPVGSITSGYLRGYSESGTRHLIIPPDFSYVKGDSLGYVRFVNPEGVQQDIAIVLDDDLNVFTGSLNKILLSNVAHVAESEWTLSSIAMNQEGSFTACGEGVVHIAPVITETRTISDYINGVKQEGTTRTESRSYTPDAIQLINTASTNHFTSEINGAEADFGCAGENSSGSSYKGSYSFSYKNSEGTWVNGNQTISLTQPAATVSTKTDDAKLSSLTLGTVSVNACGVVTLGTCTANYTQTTSKVTECGTVLSTTTTKSSKSVTASAPTVAENTSSSSRTVTITAYYSEGGIEKSASKSVTQPAATISGGVTSWNNDNATASSSRYEFPYTLSTATLSYTVPTYTTSAKVTACGTLVQAAQSGSATISWSVGSWNTDSSATKASISGTTLTVPQNTGTERKATITATFSNGVTRSFTITQTAGSHVVDVE